MKNDEGIVGTLLLAVGIVIVFCGTPYLIGYKIASSKKGKVVCEPIIKEKVVEVEKEVIIDNTDNESINYCWIQRNELQDELVDKNKDLKKTEADLLFLETLVKKERSYKDNRIDGCAKELNDISISRDDCRKHEIELSDKLEECYK